MRSKELWVQSDKRGSFISTEKKEFCKSKNVEIQYCPPRIRTRKGTVERALQTMKNLVLKNMEDENISIESVNRSLKVMQFTFHTGLRKKHILSYITVESRERN